MRHHVLWLALCPCLGLGVVWAEDGSSSDAKSDTKTEVKASDQGSETPSGPISSHLGPLSKDAVPRTHEAWPGRPGASMAPPFATEEEAPAPGAIGHPSNGYSEQCPSHHGRRWFPEAPEDPNRSVAFQSWLHRPLSCGIFLGMLSGGNLIDDWVRQDIGVIGGLRCGWDMDDYWGAEARYAMSSLKLKDSPWASQMYPIGGNARHSDHLLLDANMVFYPWGDTRLRPFILFGFGYGQVDFHDRAGLAYRASTVTIPIGVGVKYQQSERFALRLDCNDTVIFSGGAGMDTLHDFSLTAGLEFRFGGNRRSYWPWNPGTNYW